MAQREADGGGRVRRATRPARRRPPAGSPPGTARRRAMRRRRPSPHQRPSRQLGAPPRDRQPLVQRPLARAEPVVPVRDVGGGAQQVGGAASCREAGHPALDRVDEVRAQLRRVDDAAHRPHLDRPLDAVDRVELGPRALRASRSAPPPTAPRARPAGAGASAPSAAASRSSSAGDPRVGPRARVSTSRAKTTAAAGAPPITDACAPSSATASRCVVEALGEHHEGAAVVAGDDAEDDRPVEVHDRAADLRAVLELPLAHRLGRAVEAREVRQHDERAAPADGVDGAGDLLRRLREQRPRGPAGRARRPAPPRSASAAATRCPSSATGRPPRWASQTTALSAPRIAAQRSSGSWSASIDGAHDACGCRTASCAPGSSRR